MDFRDFSDMLQQRNMPLQGFVDIVFKYPEGLKSFVNNVIGGLCPGQAIKVIVTSIVSVVLRMAWLAFSIVALTFLLLVRLVSGRGTVGDNLSCLAVCAAFYGAVYMFAPRETSNFLLNLIGAR